MLPDGNSQTVRETCTVSPRKLLHPLYMDQKELNMCPNMNMPQSLGMWVPAISVPRVMEPVQMGKRCHSSSAEIRDDMLDILGLGT